MQYNLFFQTEREFYYKYLKVGMSWKGHPNRVIHENKIIGPIYLDSDLKSILRSTKKQESTLSRVPKFLTFKREIEIWKVLNPQIRKSILLSYQLYIRKSFIKYPAMVSIPSWQNIEPVYQDFIKIKRLKKPSQFYRVMGMHQKTIRFGKIHFACDLIEDKKVWSVHVDAHRASFNPIQFTLHNLADFWGANIGLKNQSIPK